MVSVSAFWDPAFASAGAEDTTGSQRGDAAVLAAVFADGGGGYWLHGLRYVTHDPSLSVDPARQLCAAAAAFAEAMSLPSLRVETNGIGKFLPGLLRQVLSEGAHACAVIEVHQSRPKDLRIAEAFDAVLAAGALHAHRSVWETPFIREMREWRPGGGDRRTGSRQRDDGLDAVAGCLLSEPVRLPRTIRPAVARTDAWRGGRPVRANTGFEI